MRRVGIASLTAVVGAGLLAACTPSTAVRPEVLQAWVGRPAMVLEKDWGPATREGSEGGQRVLRYDQVDKKSLVDPRAESSADPRSAGQGYAQRQANAAARPTTVYIRSYYFWVDAAGTIVRADMRQP